MDNSKGIKETTYEKFSIYLSSRIWILFFKPFPVFFPYIHGNCFLTAHMLKIRKTSVALWAVSWVPIRARVSNIISYLLLYGTWVTNVSKEIMISIYNSTTARPTDLFFFFFLSSLDFCIASSPTSTPFQGRKYCKKFFFFTIINNTFFISILFILLQCIIKFWVIYTF